MLSNAGPGHHPVAHEIYNNEHAGWRLGEITGTGKARELIEDPDEQRAFAVMRQMRTRGASPMAIRDAVRAEGFAISHETVRGADGEAA